MKKNNLPKLKSSKKTPASPFHKSTYQKSVLVPKKLGPGAFLKEAKKLKSSPAVADQVDPNTLPTYSIQTEDWEYGRNPTPPQMYEYAPFKKGDMIFKKLKSAELEDILNGENPSASTWAVGMSLSGQVTSTYQQYPSTSPGGYWEARKNIEEYLIRTGTKVGRLLLCLEEHKKVNYLEMVEIVGALRATEISARLSNGYVGYSYPNSNLPNHNAQPYIWKVNPNTGAGGYSMSTNPHTYTSPITSPISPLRGGSNTIIQSPSVPFSFPQKPETGVVATPYISPSTQYYGQPPYNTNGSDPCGDDTYTDQVYGEDKQSYETFTTTTSLKGYLNSYLNSEEVFYKIQKCWNLETNEVEWLAFGAYDEPELFEVFDGEGKHQNVLSPKELAKMVLEEKEKLEKAEEQKNLQYHQMKLAAGITVSSSSLVSILQNGRLVSLSLPNSPLSTTNTITITRKEQK